MSERYDLPNGRVLIIEQDPEPPNPLKEWDCALGTMVCFHNRYDLGNKHVYSDAGEAKDDAKKIEKEGGIVLPLFLYDHGGTTMNTTGFSCEWDSGQVGFIWVTAKKIKEVYGKLDDATRATAEASLKAEVETYDQYLTGDVYGFIVAKADDEDDQEDSCWGFFGSDLEENGILDHLDEADKAAVRKQV